MIDEAEMEIINRNYILDHCDIPNRKWGVINPRESRAKPKIDWFARQNFTKADIIRCHEQGMSQKTMAANYGVTIRCIRTALKHSGIKRTHKGPRYGPKGSIKSDLTDQHLIYIAIERTKEPKTRWKPILVWLAQQGVKTTQQSISRKYLTLWNGRFTSEKTFLNKVKVAREELAASTVLKA